MTNDVTVDVAVLQEQFSQINRTLARIEDKVDGIVERYEGLQDTVQRHEQSLDTLGAISKWGGGLLAGILLKVFGIITFGGN